MLPIAELPLFNHPHQIDHIPQMVGHASGHSRHYRSGPRLEPVMLIAAAERRVRA
jgi:hypothetical protein